MSAKPDSELVASVQRALGMLDAFTIDDASLGLAELSKRMKLPKTTVFRLARTLAASGYLVQLENSAWRLGPATAWLGARYQVAFDIHNTIEPIMRKLALSTHRSVSYFVHDGNARIRLLSVPAPELQSVISRVGEQMPLEKGSPGQVLLAFSGRKGRLYDQIRKRGYHFTIGEAKGASASVAAPVFGARWNVVGALCIGVPAREATESALMEYAPELVHSAEELSRALSAEAAERTPLALARSNWFPS